MSWGERSCTGYGSCTMPNVTPLTCHVDCEGYTYDGVSKQDTVASLEECLEANEKMKEMMQKHKRHHGKEE